MQIGNWAADPGEAYDNLHRKRSHSILYIMRTYVALPLSFMDSPVSPLHKMPHEATANVQRGEHDATTRTPYLCQNNSKNLF